MHVEISPIPFPSPEKTVGNKTTTDALFRKVGKSTKSPKASPMSGLPQPTSNLLRKNMIAEQSDKLFEQH